MRPCSPKPWKCSTRFRWRIATPRATSMNTCWVRSPPPDRMASSVRRDIIIQLMVELAQPTPDRGDYDPAGHMRLPGRRRRISCASTIPHFSTTRSGASIFVRGCFMGTTSIRTMLRIGVDEYDSCMASRTRTFPIVTVWPRSTRTTQGPIRWFWPIRRLPGRLTMKRLPRTCSRSSKPRRPSCSSSPCFYGS